MGHWLASAADQQRKDWIKRFDARFWTVDFPRPMLASVVTTGPRALRVECVFHKRNDLAGLVWESADRHDHPLLGYATSRDYRGSTLSFRWQSSGSLKPLDAVNGPVLTIEGRDAGGAARSWYVRLWNYAVGTPADCRITLDFDTLKGGFLLPAEADPVWAGDIDRMFVSLVPAAFDNSNVPLPAAVAATLELSDIACDGAGSSLRIGDAFVPPHGLRIANGYDDCYDLTPARLLRGMVQTGYAGVIDHYVGMSHFPALAWDGAAFTVSGGIAAPAAAWHADFLARAKASGFEVIQSLSFELLDQHCPQAWKQRDADGERGGDRLHAAVDPPVAVERARRSVAAWHRRRLRSAGASGGPTRALPDRRAVVVGRRGQPALRLRRGDASPVRRRDRAGGPRDPRRPGDDDPGQAGVPRLARDQARRRDAGAA